MVLSKSCFEAGVGIRFHVVFAILPSFCKSIGSLQSHSDVSQVSIHLLHINDVLNNGLKIGLVRHCTRQYTAISDIQDKTRWIAADIIVADELGMAADHPHSDNR